MARTIGGLGVALAALCAGCGGPTPTTHEGGFWVPDEGRIVDLSRASEGATTTIATPGSVAQLEPGRLVAPLVVIDVVLRRKESAEFAFSADDLAEYEGRELPIPAGAFVVLRTGAGAGAPVKSGRPEEALRHPGFSAAVVDLLARQRGAVGFGSDAPALDPTSAAAPIAREAALRAGRFVVTGLAGLDQVVGGRALAFVGAPLDAKGSAPLRVLALVPRTVGSPSK
jgi:kynurenine formamidase